MTKILDNLSNQEIKELIYNKKVKINELSVSALNSLLDYETDLICFGKGDMDLICEISDALDKINQDDTLSKENIQRIIQKTKAERIDVINNKAIAGRRITFKKIAITAAAIILIMAISMVVATAFGFEIKEIFTCNDLEFDFDKLLGETARLPEGGEININGITFRNNGEVTYYSDIQELMENEQLKVMYPAKMPEGIKIDTVRYTDVPNKGSQITITTNDNSTFVEINTNYTIINTFEDFKDCEIYEHNDIAFYIFKDKEVYYAFTYKDNTQYIINTANYKDLIFIITNFEE